MKRQFLPLSALFVAMAATPVAAQSAPGAAAGVPATTTASAAPPIDPARLAAATITVDHVFPVGTYARLMSGSMTAMTETLINNSGAIPLREVAALAGQPPAEFAKLGKTTLADIMAILDPAYKQRNAIILHATMTAMTGVVAELEPSIRQGVAEAYARRFSARQLADMNRFFDTPSGQAYAANAMTIQTDPAVMSRMQTIVPILMQRLPAALAQAGKGAGTLPPVRKFSDLSPAERTRLAGMLGVPEAQLETNAHSVK